MLVETQEKTAEKESSDAKNLDTSRVTE